MTAPTTETSPQDGKPDWQDIKRIRGFDASLGPVRIRGGRFYTAASFMDVVIVQDFLGEVTAQFSPSCEHIDCGFRDANGSEYIPRQYRLLASEQSQ